MRILIALILLPGMLLGQAARVGHSHFGMTAQERVRHASRPHVHVHGRHDHHAHHQHRHEEPTQPATPTHDHDTNVIYVGCVELLPLTLGSEASALSDFHNGPITLATILPASFCEVSVYTRTHGPPLAAANCLLYLRLLSLRC